MPELRAFQVRLTPRVISRRFQKEISAALVLLPGLAFAEPLGFALSISNDSIGEFRDRWQSSSVQAGILWGEMPNGVAPRRLGTLYEFRFRSDILTPERLDVIVPSDRRHAGVFALGVHSHAGEESWQARVGADVIVVGPQTGLLDLQKSLHRALGFTIPRLEGFEIANSVRVDVSAEFARRYVFDGGALRPFAEVQVGVEDLARVGVDVSFGEVDALSMRSVTTGHRLPFRAAQSGWSASLGADIAWVKDSLFLPENLGYTLSDARVRLRGGVRYASRLFEVFYGLTYLSEEFEAQREGQFVGTFQARLRF